LAAILVRLSHGTLLEMRAPQRGGNAGADPYQSCPGLRAGRVCFESDNSEVGGGAASRGQKPSFTGQPGLEQGVGTSGKFTRPLTATRLDLGFW